MKLYDNTGTTMVEIHKLERRGDNLVMQTNIMESMPTDVYVRPAEFWKLFGLVLKWQIISYLPALVWKAWQKRERKPVVKEAAAGLKTGAKPVEAPKAAPAAPKAAAGAPKPVTRSKAPLGPGEYDIIVVGAGNNGLIVGGYLAKAGLKTLVLEARSFLGGGVVTQEITVPGFRHDVASTAAGWLDMNPLIKDDELGLVKRSGIKFLPPPEVQEAQIFPDDRALIIYRDIDKTCASIEQFSHKDADSFRKLYDRALPLLQTVLKGSNMPPPSFGSYLNMMSGSPTGIELMRTTLMNGVDFVQEWFENDYVKIMMTRWAATARISPYEAGTANGVLFQVPWTVGYGMKLMEGGAGKFTDALAEAIKAYGGTIRTEATVKQIIVDNNRATGVILENGEKIAARQGVVASINVKSLFPGMVPDARLPAGFVNWISRLKPQRVQYYTIHLAAHQAPKYKAGGDADRGFQVHISSTADYEDYLNGLNTLYRGGVRSGSAGIVTATLFDPTRAPAGKHTIWINTQEPFYLQGGPQRWDEIKSEVTAGILKAIRERTTNMGPENIIAQKDVTPLDYARWNPAWIEGDPSHLGGYSYQSMSNRPVPGWGAYKMPIEGLYMCGPSTHPGTGFNAGARAPVNTILKGCGIEFSEVI
ncbi:MAG: NAD(P)/FAD-dependent oxidoreductase [Chloroflexota bacterium]